MSGPTMQQCEQELATVWQLNSELKKYNKKLDEHIAELQYENIRVRVHISDLYLENLEMQKYIDESEETMSSLIDGLFSENELEIRDLKQQAKGVNSAIETLEIHDSDNLREEVITVIDLCNYRLGLEYTAKALKDQG
jgi:hypothetical protein